MRYLDKTFTLCLLIGCAVASARALEPGCSVSTSPRGEQVVTRVLAAPLPRAHEVVADAMQAMGVFLFRDTEELVEGERTQERVMALGLPRGDEAIRAELTPLTRGSETSTQVRVETRRGSNKKGTPKHVWSVLVLDQAGCLLGLLSLDDPLRRAKNGSADGPEVQIADATQIAVRSRRFFFDTDLKANKLVVFETAEDVVVNNSLAVPSGSLVMASVGLSSDIGEFSRGAQGQLQFRYLILPDGTKLALRGSIDLRGKGANLNRVEKGLVIASSIASGADFASGTGSGFAVPAGTLFYAQVNGEQKIHAIRARDRGEKP
jgi:hypothetical protein